MSAEATYRILSGNFPALFPSLKRLLPIHKIDGFAIEKPIQKEYNCLNFEDLTNLDLVSVIRNITKENGRDIRIEHIKAHDQKQYCDCYSSCDCPSYVHVNEYIAVHWNKYNPSYENELSRYNQLIARREREIEENRINKPKNKEIEAYNSQLIRMARSAYPDHWRAACKLQNGDK